MVANFTYYYYLIINFYKIIIKDFLYYWITLCILSLFGIIVSKVDQQIFVSEFDTHWGSHISGLKLSLVNDYFVCMSIFSKLQIFVVGF